MGRTSGLERAVDSLFITIPLLFKTLLHDPETLGHNPMSSDFRLLAILVRRGPMPISKAATILGVSKPNMTKVLNKLFNEGKVHRSQNSQDKRITMIEITDIGRAYLESCTESAKELVRRRLDDLNPEERRSLFKTIDSLKLILTKINEKKKDDTIQ